MRIYIKFLSVSGLYRTQFRLFKKYQFFAGQHCNSAISELWVFTISLQSCRSFFFFTIFPLNFCHISGTFNDAESFAGQNLYQFRCERECFLFIIAAIDRLSSRIYCLVPGETSFRSSKFFSSCISWF